LRAGADVVAVACRVVVVTCRVVVGRRLVVVARGLVVGAAVVVGATVVGGVVVVVATDVGGAVVAAACWATFCAPLQPPLTASTTPMSATPNQILWPSMMRCIRGPPSGRDGTAGCLPAERLPRGHLRHSPKKYPAVAVQA
jgi:hypothetical protein